ncbi:MAG: peptidoglycan editing factor PgeF [Syntrophobacteria bacterium]
MAASTEASLPRSPVLQPHEENGLPFYRFHGLSTFGDLEHGIFTRLGGVSSPPFASLNVSRDTGDAFCNVRENIGRVQAATEFSTPIYARQSHSSNLAVLHRYPRIDPEVPYQFVHIDGFITQLPGLLLMVKVADCQAIFLYDPKKRVIANIHAGWRGSLQNIAAKAVHLMEAHFHCRPQDIFAAIGPSLGPCCAEFRNWRQELPPTFSRARLKEDHFDFWATSENQLHEAGVRRENIETAGLCTRCHPKIFYSYRGEGRTGRFAAAIGIKA